MRLIHHFYPRTLTHHVVALDDGADQVKLELTKLRIGNTRTFNVLIQDEPHMEE